MITSLKGLTAKAVQQISTPAMVTDIPMSKWKYLFTILARMSSPPVEALMLNVRACDALRSSTKQMRSNHRSPMTECTGLSGAMRLS